MTANELHDLAYEYAEMVADRPLDPMRYRDASTWFKAKGGNQQDYSIFWDVVHMWTKNRIELQLSDAYVHFPEW